jgi:hypothetical protein
VSPSNWGLVFATSDEGWHDGWKAESYSGSRSGPQGFEVGQDADNRNLLTKVEDGFLDLETLEVWGF